LLLFYANKQLLCKEARTLCTWERPGLLIKHIHCLWAIAWSPEGTLLASGGDDGTVQIWHALTGEKKRTYSTPSINVQALAWSPDGTRIASDDDSGTVNIWLVEKNNAEHPLFAYQGHEEEP